MKSTLLNPPGQPIEIEKLTVPKAAELAHALQNKLIDFVELIETRVTREGEVVVFDVEVELPQKRHFSIMRRERIATIFYKEDSTYPEVLAQRSDFPNVLHLNLRDEDFPRSLCLYQEPYCDIKIRWTAARLVARIRNWLALTAKNKLHPDDQPLERILMDLHGILLLPSDSASSQNAQTYEIIRSPEMTDVQDSRKILVLTIRAEPQEHSVIHHRPKTLTDLSDMLIQAGIDLIPSLRVHLRRFLQEENDLGRNLIVNILFPRLRVAGGAVERVEEWAFQARKSDGGKGTIPASIRDVGESLDVYQMAMNKVGLVLNPVLSKKGDDILIEVLNPLKNIDSATLSILNDQKPAEEQPKLCAIGAGALGSQIIMNLARSGYGLWTIIDDDILLPHNLARHALTGNVKKGASKAEAIAEAANSLTDGDDLFKAIPVSILNPLDKQDDVSVAISTSASIIDLSASLSVSRHLSLDAHSPAPRMSLFLTPTGADLVLLAEDSHRAIQLHELEMQYYRASVNDERLSGHLETERYQIRYGQSCRDLSFKLPQDLVALHAAIGSKAIRSTLAQSDARIHVWRSSETSNVILVSIEPRHVIRRPTGDWTVITDVGLLDKLQAFRQTKLPNETGGVLLGSFDVERQIVYIVDTIPSPPDSQEWPTLYIRGRRGLSKQVTDVSTATDGMLEYIGEWHSHPKGASTIPSDDDELVFSWIVELMNRDGLPAVMMIVGDEGDVNCFVAKIEKQENLLPESSPC